MSVRKDFAATFTPEEVRLLYDLLGHVEAAHAYGLDLDQRVIDAIAARPELASVAAKFAALRDRARGDA